MTVFEPLFSENGSPAASVVMTWQFGIVPKEEMAQVDINDAIQKVLALTRSELQQHQVSVHTDLFSEDTLVMGDRVQLQQVLLNLIKNGAEAMSAITDRAKMLEIKGQIT